MNCDKFKAICTKAIVAALLPVAYSPWALKRLRPVNHRDCTICLFCRRSTLPGRNVSIHRPIWVVSLHSEREGWR